MRMYAFCIKCNRALSGAGGLCLPCMRRQPVPQRRVRNEKQPVRSR